MLDTSTAVMAIMLQTFEHPVQLGDTPKAEIYHSKGTQKVDMRLKLPLKHSKVKKKSVSSPRL